MNLTERERLALEVVLRLFDVGEVEIEMEAFAKNMRYVKPISSTQTDRQRQKHAQIVLHLLTLKLKAHGIDFNRVSKLGSGYKGRWNFGSKTDRRAAKKFMETQH